jgi:hypothetical protein
MPNCGGRQLKLKDRVQKIVAVHIARLNGNNGTLAHIQTIP